MAHLHGRHVPHQPPHPAVCHPAAPAGHPSLTPALPVLLFVFMTHFRHCSRRSHAICLCFRALPGHSFMSSHIHSTSVPLLLSPTTQGTFLGAVVVQMHGCPSSSKQGDTSTCSNATCSFQPLTCYMCIRPAHCTSNSTKPNSPCLHRPAACCLVCTAAFIIAACDSCSVSTCKASSNFGFPSVRHWSLALPAHVMSLACKVCNSAVVCMPTPSC